MVRSTTLPRLAFRPRFKMRGKVLGLAASIAVLLTLSLTAFSYLSLRKSTLANTEAVLDAKAHEVLQRTEEAVAAQADLLRALALSPEVVQAVSSANDSISDEAQAEAIDQAWQENAPAADSLATEIAESSVSQFLRAFQGQFPQQVEVFVTDAHGRNVAMTARTGDYLQSDEAWWGSTFGGATFVDEVAFDESTGAYAINIGVPVRSADQQTVIGVLRGTIDISVLFEALAKVKTGETGQALLVDAAGRVLFSPDEAQVMKEAPPALLALRERAAGTPRSDVTDAAGNPAAVGTAASAEGGLGWMILLDQDLAELESGIRTSLGKSLLVAAVLLLILLGVGAWLARFLTEPIRQLDEAAQRVAGGDLQASVAINTTDEIGTLADSFNQMVATVRTALADAEENGRQAEAAAARAEAASAEAEAERAYLERQVEVAVAEMAAFADGDLTVRLEADRDGPVARLFAAFNRSVAQTRETIEEVRTSAEAAAAAAAQIGASTDHLAAGAQEQSAQAQEVAAAVEEMVHTILDTSRNATATAANAAKDAMAAEEGSVIVGDTVAKIREIAAVVADSRSTIERLGASSEKVGTIVGTIEDIADQTNLLALNAAIEAARAGDQGRGFAVVADEVRKLAERTTAATTEVGEMIEQIRRETADAVTSMRRGSKEVDEGIALADRAGEALRAIVAGASQSEAMVGQIAAAAEEQSTTSEEMARSVESISAVSAEAAQGIGQIAGAASDLGQLTEGLRTLVGQFRTDAAPTDGDLTMIVRARSTTRPAGREPVEAWT